MNKCAIEEIYNSLELPIGTKFYFRDRLYEVAELEEEWLWGCSKCEFDDENKEDICEVMNCNYCRHDRKYIYFKEAEEAKEEPVQL